MQSYSTGQYCIVQYEFVRVVIYDAPCIGNVCGYHWHQNEREVWLPANGGSASETAYTAPTPKQSLNG